MSLYIFINMERNYIIQEREFIRSGNPVYKIGKTFQTMMERLAGYPKGSEIIISYEVIDSLYVESLIIAKFREKFERQNDIGREYFKGDKNEMIDLFYKICSENKNKKSHDLLVASQMLMKDNNNTTSINIKTESTHVHLNSNQYQCISSEKTFTQKSHYIRDEDSSTCIMNQDKNCFKCEACNKNFALLSNLTRHEESSFCVKNINKKHKCENCDETFDTKNSCTRHIKQCETKYRCSNCNKIFDTKNSRTRHTKQCENIGFKITNNGLQREIHDIKSQVQELNLDINDLKQTIFKNYML